MDNWAIDNGDTLMSLFIDISTEEALRPCPTYRNLLSSMLLMITIYTRPRLSISQECSTLTKVQV